MYLKFALKFSVRPRNFDQYTKSLKFLLIIFKVDHDYFDHDSQESQSFLR